MTTESDRFRSMADRIEKNAGEVFAGAAVIYPPEGEPIEFLTLDPTPSTAQFWGSVQARIGMILAELEAAERQAGRR